MARIRTIKPEFFRHEAIQDLEIDNQGSYVMLVYAALWGHCDSNGVFEYRPRQLKLDILPFLDFKMQDTLQLLVSAGFIKKYEVNGKEYGFIKSFCEHQRLTGKEATEGVKFPFNSEIVGESQNKISESIENQQDNNCEALGKHWGNTGEIPDVQEKEREGKGKGKGIGRGMDSASAPVADATTPTTKKQTAAKPEFAEKPETVSDALWSEWLHIRKTKKQSTPTPRAMQSMAEEASKAGLGIVQAITECCDRGWAGFKADWYENSKATPRKNSESSKSSEPDFSSWGKPLGWRTNSNSNIIEGVVLQ